MKLNRMFTCFLFSLLFTFFNATAAVAQQWRPVDPEHLAQKAPKVEKDADAEAIFWDVRVNDAAFGGTEYTHYIRIKIFTERGRESQSKIDIEYERGEEVRDVMARTIKPDGTIVEVKKESIFEREVMKFGSIRKKAKSFAMPAVEPGAIVEYRWRQVTRNDFYFATPLMFQRDIPVQLVRYHLKPAPNTYAFSTRALNTIAFNANETPFTREKDGFYSKEAANIPAYRMEPQMPPPYAVFSWMLAYYEEKDKQDPKKYWKEMGKLFHEIYKPEIRVNDDIRKAAAGAIGDASTPEQKLERLFEFARTKIKNVDDDASGYTKEQLEKMKENKSSTDTLKRGYGSGHDIRILFAALVNAAGFEARCALIGDRGLFFFDPRNTSLFFMQATRIAVRAGNDWKFYDPGDSHLPCGMLNWRQEGEQALITDPKEPFFVTVPVTPAEKSAVKRLGKLRLGEDGALEGDLRVEYTGQFASSMRERYDDQSPSQREESLREEIKKRISAVELSAISISGLDKPGASLVCSYHVRVPGYAERTGKRLFLQPGFFHKGDAPYFPSKERYYNAYFRFPWTEEDYVEFDLPPGFALDNAEAPGSINSGDAGHYKTSLGLTKDEKTMVYRRSFRFNLLMVPKDAYSQLKQLFDVVHQEDGHTVTLKQSAVAAVKQ